MIDIKTAMKDAAQSKEECRAYKPWISTEDASGQLQKACQACLLNGKCEWTGEGPDYGSSDA